MGLNAREAAMIDSQTRRKLRVSIDGTAGPYIMVPVDQLSEVQELLDQNEIKHWAESDAISLDGGPAVAVINLGHDGDAAKVQSILDSAD
jgi:hypothetical protein